MANNPALIIRVEKPEGELADIMNEMRSWLDEHGIQPVKFKISVTGMPIIAFDIQFQREDDAVLFAQVFT